MRKALLITGLLAAFSFTAAAENIVTIQGSYMNVSRAYTAESGGDKAEARAAITSWGSTVTGFFEIGQGIGVLTGVGAYFPTYYEGETKVGSEKVEYDDELEDGGVVVAGDLGAGYNLSGPDLPFGVVLGAGAHLNFYSLSEGDDIEEQHSLVIGAGVQVLPYYAFSDVVYATGLFKLAMDFAELSRDPEVPEAWDHAVAWHVSFGLGVGFRL